MRSPAVRRTGSWHRSALFVLFVVVVAACAWPMSGFDPARTNFNLFENRIGVTNVAALQQSWSGPTATAHVDPVVANGVVYAAVGEFPFGVQAFDAKGVTGCSGNPKVCTPLWQGTSRGGVSSLAVANGRVFVGSTTGEVAVFDAAGVQGCSGVPKACTPLWTILGVDAGSFVVASGFLYARTPVDGLYAFDAAGIIGCAGVPKLCTPLWHAELGGVPAVANGIVYASSQGSPLEVRAFDAKGVQNCGGTPRVCTPLWTGRQASAEVTIATAPVIANGLVFVGRSAASDFSWDGELNGFDAAGVRGCAGTPKTCLPIWRAPADGVIKSPAVANGLVYVTSHFSAMDDSGNFTSRDRVRAFSVDGCMTSLPACSPIWTAPAAYSASPSVANGVVYVKLISASIGAFDATGSVNCSGTPRTCTPLHEWPAGVEGITAAVVDGTLYLHSPLRAYRLP